MGPRTCTQHSPSNVSQSIHHAPSQAEAFTCMYRRCWFLRKQNDTLVSSLLLYAQTDRLPRSHPSSNRGFDTTDGSLGESGGPATSRLEQPHKQERRHTLTQNLKAIGLWILLLIRCSTFTFLSDVGHITHTCTQQHSPSSVSPSIHHAPPQAKAVTCMYRHCWFLRKRADTLVPPLLLSAQTDRLPRSYPSSNRGSDTTVGSLGELGGPATSRLEQPHKQERRHTLTQNLKAMGLWVLLLIRCSTFTFLSDVGHITHTDTQQQF